jgi:hypothetical protein
LCNNYKPIFHALLGNELPPLNDPPKEQPNDGFGSITAINYPVRVGSGTGHKAVIHQVQIAVSLIAGVGQKQNNWDFSIDETR